MCHVQTQLSTFASFITVGVLYAHGYSVRCRYLPVIRQRVAACYSLAPSVGDRRLVTSKDVLATSTVPVVKDMSYVTFGHV